MTFNSAMSRLALAMAGFFIAWGFHLLGASMATRTCRSASSAGASSVLRRLDYQKMETMAESARRVGSLSPSLT
jgi:hypothetical protein